MMESRGRGAERDHLEERYAKRADQTGKHTHEQPECPCPAPVAQSCLTLSPAAPLSMGFSRQEYWNVLPFPFPGDLPDTRIKPKSPELQADSFFLATLLLLFFNLRIIALQNFVFFPVRHQQESAIGTPIRPPS